MEWASHGLGALFAQRSNLCSPSFLRMFGDMLRFNRAAPGVLRDPQYRDVSLGQYLARHVSSQSAEPPKSYSRRRCGSFSVSCATCSRWKAAVASAADTAGIAAALSLLLLEQDQPPTLFLSVHLAQLLGADGRAYFAESRGLVLCH